MVSGESVSGEGTWVRGEGKWARSEWGESE